MAAPQMLPGQRVVNDAAYLVEQSGPLLWVFTAVALVRLTRHRLVLVALAAPMVRAMRAVEAASRPGDVVLQRPGARFPPAPVILIGRRVPYERFTPWLTQFAAAEDLQRRHEVVYRFFRTTDDDEARQIAAGLGARFVCLYGNDRLRFEAATFFQPLRLEAGAECYTVP